MGIIKLFKENRMFKSITAATVAVSYVSA